MEIIIGILGTLAVVGGGIFGIGLIATAIANATGGTVKRYDPIRYQEPVITDSGNVCNGCSTAGINSGQRGGEPELTEWEMAGQTTDDGCTTHEQRSDAVWGEWMRGREWEPESEQEYEPEG